MNYLHHIKEYLKENLSFLLPFCVLWICGLSATLIQTKTDTHLMLNQYHTDALDWFFKYYTQTGEWIPFAIIGITLFVCYRNAIFLGASLALSSLITTLLKHICNIPRPSVLFESLNINLPAIVDGVSLHKHLSFPSGHTTAAFSMFYTLAMIADKKWQKIICLILATLTGYSRIYLSQHFLQDVLAGSLIAIISTTILAHLFIKKQWGDKNLYHTLKWYLMKTTRH